MMLFLPLIKSTNVPVIIKFGKKSQSAVNRTFLLKILSEQVLSSKRELMMFLNSNLKKFLYI